MDSMFEAYCMGKRAWQLSIKFFMRLWVVEKSKDSLKACFENVNQAYVIHEAMMLQKSKDSLKACFENVNIDT